MAETGTRNETNLQPEICTCEPPPELTTKTAYVRFVNGEQVQIPDVRNVHLTGRNVVIVRLGQTPITFPRGDVYFVSCEECLPGTQY
jgi:hypothetical protein